MERWDEFLASLLRVWRYLLSTPTRRQLARDIAARAAHAKRQQELADQRAHDIRLAQIEATAQADAAVAIGQAFADAMKATAAAQERSMNSMLQMVQEQQRTLQTWLEGFRVAEIPNESSVVRDEDEVNAARERMQSRFGERKVPVTPQDLQGWLNAIEQDIE